MVANKPDKRETPNSYYVLIFVMPVLWLSINYIPLVYNYTKEKNMSLIPVIVLLFLLLSINVYYKKIYGIKPSEVFASLIITIGILFFGSSFMVSISSGRNYAMLAGCESSIKELAIALENYGGDYNHYPPALNCLLKSGKKGPYLKELPRCNAKIKHYWPLPYRDKSPCYNYILSDKTDNYTIWCNSPGIHAGAGLSPYACWPQYTPDRGLILSEK